jgi:hypothetical protein
MQTIFLLPREYMITVSNNSFVMVEIPLLDFHLQGNDFLGIASHWPVMTSYHPADLYLHFVLLWEMHDSWSEFQLTPVSFCLIN